jgi:hypothetical protein
LIVVDCQGNRQAPKPENPIKTDRSGKPRLFETSLIYLNAKRLKKQHNPMWQNRENTLRFFDVLG